jgi:RNA polymerase sigma-70 factor (family 1)
MPTPKRNDKILESIEDGGSDSVMKREEFQTIYNEYWETLYAIGYNRLKSKAEVEDLIQELFLEIWKNFELIRIKENLRFYLYSAIKYKIIDHFRKRKLDQTTLSECSPHLLVASSYEPDEVLSFNELSDKIKAGVDGLPERCKLIFTMSREMGRTSSEIAEELQVSKRTVETQIYQSLKHLKAQLNKYTATILFLFVAFFADK